MMTALSGGSIGFWAFMLDVTLDMRGYVARIVERRKMFTTDAPPRQPAQ